MQTPKQFSFTKEQVEGLIDRLEKKALKSEDYPLLIELIKGLVWLNLSLKEKTLSIKRLRAVFGIKTETASKLFDLLEKEEDKKKGSNQKKKKERKKGGSGHRAASEYTEAKTIKIAHEALQKGDLCPDCKKGKLFNLSPGTILRIIGMPSLQVEIYRPEKLRCSLCGTIFTAKLPEGIMKGSRSDKTAKAIVSLLKYRGGLPFYRQEQLQKILGTPVVASELWKMTQELADDLLEVYALMCHTAAQGQILHNDDTKARILSIMAEKKGKEEKRKGIFTTGVISKLKDPQIDIALFFTGRQHAGENMNDLLNLRKKELSDPILQCDGGPNIPKDHKILVSYCFAHTRRKFYELFDDYPRIVLKIIGWFSEIFANDKNGPSEGESRLKYHQEKSEPIMDKLLEYCNKLLENKEVEPNSSMGKAIAYMKNHWIGLTLFLREKEVPLTNNDLERLLKRSVLNRKNAYFYRTEEGARIGDILMSTIETCVMNEVNPWKYLLAIQEHQKKVRKHPELWLPWCYEKEMSKLGVKQEEAVHSQ